jgi:hypothetical protein
MVTALAIFSFNYSLIYLFLTFAMDKGVLAFNTPAEIKPFD